MSKDYKFDTLYTGSWDGRCPCCDAEATIGENGEPEWFDGFIDWPMICRACGTTWTEEYAYAGFIHYKEEE